MNTKTFSIRIDENLREEATEILESYGLSPTQAIKLFFNEVVATRKVPLSFDYQAPDKQPTAKLLKAIAELDNGDTTTYENLDEFIAALKSKKIIG